MAPLLLALVWGPGACATAPPIILKPVSLIARSSGVCSSLIATISEYFGSVVFFLSVDVLRFTAFYGAFLGLLLLWERDLCVTVA